MKTHRIQIVSVDVVKADLAHGVAYLVYTLRAPIGDNHSATDVPLESVQRMSEELFEAARAKAAVLAQAFSAVRSGAEDYMIKDARATQARLTPLFTRLLEARKHFQAGTFDEAERTRLETDGVHLLRPDLDLDDKPLEERVAVLVRRAGIHLEQSNPEPARLMAERALRIQPDEARAAEIVARCRTEARP